eukprot:7383856-Prymnesium_polylepis.1
MTVQNVARWRCGAVRGAKPIACVYAGAEDHPGVRAACLGAARYCPVELARASAVRAVAGRHFGDDVDVAHV